MNVKTTGRQAIVTKWLSPTNYKPSRIKASCERGSVVVSWEYAKNVDENHAAAVEALLAKFDREDAAKYSTPNGNGWGAAKWRGGATETGYVFVQVVD